MEELLKSIRTIKRDESLVALLLKSAGATITVIAAAATLNTALREIFELEQIPRESYPYLIMVFGSLFFIFLALFIYYSRSVALSSSGGFCYDGNGVIWNGNEQNIAFRVATFRRIISGFETLAGANDINKMMFDTGVVSGEDFGRNFGAQIYPTELRKGGPAWTDLSVGEKLKLWADYDSATGWGKIDASKSADKIDVNVLHVTMFTGGVGDAFANFMAGYVRTVLRNILGAAYSKLELESPVRCVAGVAQMTFKLSI